jgi:hypothetical protein
MVIEVRLHEKLRKYALNSSSGMLTVDVPDEITVHELFQELEIAMQHISEVKVNNKRSYGHYKLSDGDCIDLY